MRSGRESIEHLRRLPGGAAVVRALERDADARLVGGAVRDLLLDRADPRELDIVVACEAASFARELGEIVAVHERFGTCTVQAGALRCDVARRRRERYPHPGALPVVEPGTAAEDLARRDFTVNAITLSAAGELAGAPGALEDLADRRLRVLHDASFRDDPTRLWRLVRYAVRLGFLPTPETDALAVAAVAAGALETVSAARKTSELRLVLGEPAPASTLHGLQQLGVVAGLELDPERIALALALLPGEGDSGLTLLGACLPGPAWLEPWDLTARERTILTACACAEPLPASPPARPSQIWEIVEHLPVEAIAIAGARGDATSARAWLELWSHVAPQIGGGELIAAGIAPGPDLGRRLRRVRAALLDGELDPGMGNELAFALGGSGRTI